MRKIVLLLIITMSLTMTSGFGEVSVDSQSKLNNLLKEINASGVKVEITSRTSLPATKGKTSQALNYKIFSEVTTYADNLGTHRIRKIVDADNEIYIDTLRPENLDEVLDLYVALRSQAEQHGGEVNLALSCEVPRSFAKGEELGKRVISGLGGEQELQVSQEAGAYYSVAANVPGWGKTVQVGNDRLNLEVIIQPDYTQESTQLYLTAPVFIGDLGDLGRH